MSSVQIGLAGAAAVMVQKALVWYVSANMDLPLVVVVLAALSRGPLTGLWMGTAVGFVQDMLSGGIVGVNGLCKSVVGVAAGERLLVTSSWQRSLILVAATFVHAGCFFGTYAFIPNTMPIGDWQDVAVQGVVNALVGSMAIVVAGNAPRWGRRTRGRVGLGAGSWRAKHAR